MGRSESAQFIHMEFFAILVYTFKQAILSEESRKETRKMK